MNAETTPAQRLGALTPLSDMLAVIERIAAVPARQMEVARAQGLVLAEDVIAPARRPPAPLALLDGWAVDSERVRDAGPYAPVALQPHRVEAFAAMPADTDAVAPLDAILAQGGSMQMVMPVAPGDGVLQPGAEVEAGAVLAPAGKMLSALDVAVLRIAAIAHVSVRAPAVVVANTRPQDRVLSAIATYIAAALHACGALPRLSDQLDTALGDTQADAVIGIGGTGSGRDDRAVMALRRAGETACHGVGLMPGETAAFGQVGSRPVLLLPGRLDGAVAAWLALGRPLVARLSGAMAQERTVTAVLSRKLTSPVGMASIVPVRRTGNAVAPLGSGFLSLHMLAQADGWILVPSESEGWPAGAEVSVRPL